MTKSWTAVPNRIRTFPTCGSFLYGIFGQFLDIFHGRENVPRITPAKKQRDFERCVDDFADNVARFYGTESERSLAALRIMDAIYFLHEGDTIPPLQAVSVEG